VCAGPFGPSHSLGYYLRSTAADFGVTRITGDSKDVKAYILLSVVRRRNLDKYLGLLNEHAPRAFVTVEEARDIVHGYLPVWSNLK